ncbi:uncharacterized protein METZ01_LOCUS173359, partial [marine metagenome]
MRIDVVTIFPATVQAVLREGVVAHAIERDLIEVQ